MPGYDYDFESEPDERLLCGACQLVIKDLVSVVCCGQSFCAECIFTWLSEGSQCPSCGEVLGKESISIGDIYARREIKNLRVVCRLCDQRFTLHKMKAHASRCRRTNAYELPDISGIVIPATSSRKRCKDLPSFLSGRRCKVVLIGVLCLALVIASIVVMVTLRSQEKRRDPKISEHCEVGGDPCASQRRRSTTCDLATSTCLLTVGQDCSGKHGNKCVTGALCDTGVSDVCRCDVDYQQEEDVCMLQAGVTCSGGRDMLCQPSTYCDLSVAPPYICECWSHFVRDQNTCRLKVKVAAVNCSTAVACVEHATCDAPTSTQCQCDTHYVPTSAGECGLTVGSSVSCDNMTSCVVHASCDVSNTNRCVCDADFAQRTDGTCGLLVGSSLDCTTISSCVDKATCDRTNSKQCVCGTNFVASSNGLCVLQAELLGVDCRTAAACVEHATCDSGNTNQCLCDASHRLKADGTCGLIVGASMSCSSVTSCVDHSTCDVSGTSQCVCDADFLNNTDGTCDLRSGSSLDCLVTSGHCVEHAQCDFGITRRCVCDVNYTLQADGTCLL